MQLMRPFKNVVIKCPVFSFNILLIITFVLYCIWSFPSQFSHIEPQVFESFGYSQSLQEVRDLKAMRPRVFVNQQVTYCPDIEVTKNQIVYCINDKRQIVEMNPKEKKSQVLYTIDEGNSEGLRLSKNQKLLYFTNSNLGLCEFEIQQRKVTTLVDKYQGEFLMSLNGIQIHPRNPNIVYFTQSSKVIPMENFQIEFWLSNPFGRVFDFNKKTLRLSLVAEGLYFPNGIVFQKYMNQNVLVVAQTNRNRLTRIYLNGERKGIKQVALERLQFYPDNIKAGEKGEILIGSIGFRGGSSKSKDEHSLTRKIFSRIPFFLLAVQNKDFGGIIAKLAQNRDQKNKMEYCLWESYPNFGETSTMYMRNGKLFMSSFLNPGIVVIDKIRKRLNDWSTYQDFKHTEKQMWVYNFGDRFERANSRQK